MDVAIGASPSRRVLLVVDDDVAVHRALRRQLGGLPLAVESVVSIDEARRFLSARGRDVDVVLLDRLFPGDERGEDVITELRALAGPQLMVVVHTAHHKEELRGPIWGQAAIAYIEKGSPVVLLRALATAMAGAVEKRALLSLDRRPVVALGSMTGERLGVVPVSAVAAEEEESAVPVARPVAR